MTHITSIPTKKAFKEAVLANKTVYLDDPSIFGPVSGTLEHIFKTLGETIQYPYITVTNHPKRSWFARVERVNGKWVVK